MWTGCRGSTRESECSNRISDANFLIVFHTNYGSILRSFQDMTDDGPTTATKQPTITYLALKARYTLETKLKVDKVHRACHYDPIHNYKVDGIATKYTATSCRIYVVADLLPKPATKLNVSATKSNSRLCCRFFAGFSNSRLSTKSTVLNTTLLPVCTELQEDR